MASLPVAVQVQHRIVDARFVRAVNNRTGGVHVRLRCAAAKPWLVYCAVRTEPIEGARICATLGVRIVPRAGRYATTRNVSGVRGGHRSSSLVFSLHRGFRLCEGEAR